MTSSGSGPTRIAAVDGLFARHGVDVVTHGCAATPGLVDALTVEERAAVAAAVDSRRQDFAGGRACAHASLTTLGLPDAPIPAATDRSPVWPAGAVGSITHSEGYCLAAVAHGGGVSIGLDAERVGRVTPDVADIVTSPDERRWIAAAGEPDLMATVVFAAKEALYKAQHPVTGAWLDFTDVEATPSDDTEALRLELVGAGAPVGRLGWPLAAYWTVLEPAPDVRLAVATVVV